MRHLTAAALLTPILLAGGTTAGFALPSSDLSPSCVAINADFGAGKVITFSNTDEGWSESGDYRLKTVTLETTNSR